jgi:hypothetical protein
MLHGICSYFCLRPANNWALNCYNNACFERFWSRLLHFIDFLPFLYPDLPVSILSPYNFILFFIFLFRYEFICGPAKLGY